jgi:hypothetical protein
MLHSSAPPEQWLGILIGLWSSFIASALNHCRCKKWFCRVTSSLQALGCYTNPENECSRVSFLFCYGRQAYHSQGFPSSNAPSNIHATRVCIRQRITSTFALRHANMQNSSECYDTRTPILIYTSLDVSYILTCGASGLSKQIVVVFGCAL